jgi:ComF family protein
VKHFNFRVSLFFAKRLFRRILFYLREYFFPAGCALCGSPLFTMNETWYGLCVKCHAELSDDIAWMRQADDTDQAEPSDAPNTGQAETRCDICGKPMVSGRGICLSCRNGPEHSYDKIITVFNYSGKYKDLFSAYKFSKNLALGHFFAELIIRAYRLLPTSETGTPGLFVPVPPRPGKIKKTGWDQVEYLVRLLEAGWGETENCGIADFTVWRCLKRLRSKVQKNLGRNDRLENLKGRIVMVKKAPLTAVVIDDVITTGSTMDVCASVLKAGGCRNVYGICLVYD